MCKLQQNTRINFLKMWNNNIDPASLLHCYRLYLLGIFQTAHAEWTALQPNHLTFILRNSQFMPFNLHVEFQSFSTQHRAPTGPVIVSCGFVKNIDA